MGKKISEQDLIEANNLIEEAQEIFAGCTSCGRCKVVCPVFNTLREERISPRGLGAAISEKVLEKAVFECTLCKACEYRCHMDVKVCDAVMNVREALVLKGKGTKKNKEMAEGIMKRRGLKMGR